MSTFLLAGGASLVMLVGYAAVVYAVTRARDAYGTRRRARRQGWQP